MKFTLKEAGKRSQNHRQHACRRNSASRRGQVMQQEALRGTHREDAAAEREASWTLCGRADGPHSHLLTGGRATEPTWNNSRDTSADLSSSTAPPTGRNLRNRESNRGQEGAEKNLPPPSRSMTSLETSETVSQINHTPQNKVKTHHTRPASSGTPV